MLLRVLSAARRLTPGASRPRRGGPRENAVTSSAWSVTAAIAEASRRTGVDVRYLQATAQRESGFDVNAKAATSSAAGLYQFIESTWLQTLERHGAQYGLNDANAEAGADRASLLSLRFDPHAAALMAGALTRENADALTGVLGREPDAGELYAAHVLGAGDATRLLQTASAAPETPAADLFPRAAAANRGLFYTPDGAPVTAEALRARFAGMMGEADGSAEVTVASGSAAGAARFAPQPASGVWPALRVTPAVAAILAALPTPERADAVGEGDRAQDGAEPGGSAATRRSV